MFGILSLLSSPTGLVILGLMIVCIVHAVRTGNVFPWIYILVFLPAIGALIYFFMVIVPGLRHSRGFQRFGAKAARTIDPDKDYRQAIREAEMVGSVDTKRALAEHLIQRGKYPEAIELYQNALQGQFRDDPALWQGLARAQFLNGDGAATQASLDELQRIDPKFVSPEAHLLYARALEQQGKDDEALAEYEKLVPYFTGEEARVRYAQLLEKTGARDRAKALYTEVLKSLDGAPKHYRSTQKEWGAAARAALRS
ncbi:MAG TPA: tetratricopeptide repeat protein [Rhizomicrobium sp.]|nr:tetratricopeptide repeat protein [Rhizomicrobium sp.]